MDKLNSLKIFVLVAESKSFAGAARLLGSDPSTISKSIQRLENALQVQLFHRTTRQVTTTSAGEHYLARVRETLENLDDCERLLRSDNDQVKGCLKINLPVSYGRLYVLPLIPEFCGRYPELDLELSFDDAYLDIIEHGYDVSVRSGTLQDSRVVAHQLSSMDFITCAAPGYLDKLGINKLTPSKFQDMTWISFRFKQSGKLMPIFRPEPKGLAALEAPNQIIVDDGEAMMELCRGGLGLTQVPHFIARRHLEKGWVVPVYKGFSTPGSGVFVVYARREYLPLRVRVFVDFLKEKISAMGALGHFGESASGTWALKLKV